MHRLLLLCALLARLAAGEALLIHASGFGPGVSISGTGSQRAITGGDGVAPGASDWSLLARHPGIDRIFLNMAWVPSAGPADHEMAIVPDPDGVLDPATGQTNRVLTFMNRTIAPLPGSTTSRCQLEIRHADWGLEEHYVTFRMRIHPDFALLSEFPDRMWGYMMWEAWSRSDADGRRFRTVSSWVKSPGAGKALRWRVAGEYFGSSQQVLWEVHSDVPVPLDRWFTVRRHWRSGRGDVHAGRMFLSIQEEGGPEHVICDRSGVPTIDPRIDAPPWGTDNLLPFKLYDAWRSPTHFVRDRVQGGQGQIRVWYDDFRWWSAPPDGPGPRFHSPPAAAAEALALP